jgi:peptidoglycan/LPS O-acetylase OafA/YrhL
MTPFASAVTAPQQFGLESGIVGSPAKAASIVRIEGLDALRGFAVLWVVVHNTGAIRGDLDSLVLKGLAVVSGFGWAGVQLFFALSGFLITRILLRSRGAPEALRAFYARRTLRIFPLYYVLLVLTFVIAPRVTWLESIAHRGSVSPLWYWLYLSNWIVPFGGGTAALAHVWSLAVEEQFYLVWPLLVLRMSERSIVKVCGLMLIVAYATRPLLHLFFSDPSAAQAAYEFTITRWDAIALGALVAVAGHAGQGLRLVQRVVLPALPWLVVSLAFVVLVGHAVSSQGRTTEMITMPLTAVVSAAVVAWVAVGGPPLPGRKLWRRLRPIASILSWFGTYSYAIYVFHRPVDMMLAQWSSLQLLLGTTTHRAIAFVGYFVLVLGVTTVLAICSWFSLEQPLLSLKRYFPMPRPRTHQA